MTTLVSTFFTLQEVKSFLYYYSCFLNVTYIKYINLNVMNKLYNFLALINHKNKDINLDNSINNSKELNFHEAIKYLPISIEKIRITISLMDIFIN